jgi:hypothetical protein
MRTFRRSFRLWEGKMPWSKLGMVVMLAAGFFGLAGLGISAVIVFVIGAIVYLVAQ